MKWKTYAAIILAAGMAVSAPVAAMAVRQVVMYISSHGQSITPSLGAPTSTPNTATTIRLCTMHMTLNTISFDSTYELSDMPAIYSRFNMVRSLQIS